MRHIIISLFLFITQTFSPSDQLFVSDAFLLICKMTHLKVELEAYNVCSEYITMYASNSTFYHKIFY